jgi:hypothetical protein
MSDQITREQFDAWLDAHHVPPPPRDPAAEADAPDPTLSDVTTVFIDDYPEEGLVLTVDYGESAHRAPLISLPEAPGRGFSTSTAHVRRSAGGRFRVAIVGGNGETVFTSEALENHSYAVEIAADWAAVIVDETGIGE